MWWESRANNSLMQWEMQKCDVASLGLQSECPGIRRLQIVLYRGASNKKNLLIHNRTGIGRGRKRERSRRRR